MLRVFVVAVALLIPAAVPVMAAKVDASCNQVFEAAAARARVAVARRNGDADSIIVVTGSTFVVAELREWWMANVQSSSSV